MRKEKHPFRIWSNSFFTNQLNKARFPYVKLGKNNLRLQQKRAVFQREIA